MVTIIPHPSENLKLVRFQKQLISLFYDNNFQCYRQHPLWIPLSETFIASNKHDLKELSKKIEYVKISAPFFQTKTVFLPITIKIDKTDHNLNFPILHLYDSEKKGSKDSDIKISSSLPFCPIDKLKVFRLAISERLSENSQFISESVWIKL